MAFLTVLPSHLIDCAVQSMPGMRVAKPMVFDGVLVLVLGVIVAWWSRGEAAAA